MSTNLNSIAARAILFMFIVGGPVWAEQIAIIPDTQGYTANAANHEILLEQTRWIAENSEAAELALITHVGDIISYRGSLNQDEQWRFADENYDQFDGSVPYSVAYGNHDFDTFMDSSAGSTTAQSWFGAQRYEAYEWFGGSSPSGESFYQFFNIGDQRLLHVAIKFDPDEATLAWAAELVREINLPTVVSTHAYLTDAGTSRNGERLIQAGRDRFGEAIWEQFVRSTDQIFMVICGHNHAGEDVTVSGEYSDDGEYHQISINNAGREVYELLADYQDYPNGGDGWFQLVDLNPDAGTISVTTLSPFLDKYQDDPMSRFEWQVDLQGRWRMLE